MWQRSKAHWLYDQDRNTEFFHATATTTKRQNVIQRIKDAERRWREDTEGIQEVLLEYFRGIFTSSRPSSHELDVVLNTVSPKVTDAMNDSLLQLFTEQELSFIPGRLITDNVLVAFEVNHFVKNLTRAIAGRLRGELFRAIKDRIWGRIQGWNNKLLSQAERGVLIKAVLQSIPTYVMSCFRLPDYLLHEIEMMIADFWWHNKGERRTHWVRWSKLCQQREEGGLGFKEMKAFNRVMLAKQGCKLITRPNTLLSQILRTKYFLETSFFTAQMGARPSLTWRSIMETRNLLQQG
ncbi:UNVERIFIED_CONTAM: putative mitochondrial protein [Sesamum latifolium]|uniref:Mitochondrial protein n=1 Tax=Sesamum latifolium TaxID=2727402 RepID=A0AAW2X710_9LAMI